MRAPLALAATVVVIVAGGCGSRRAPGTPPVSLSAGVFTVTVAPDTASLSVVGPNGAPLLDGIPSSNAVGTPQSMNDDAPPMTGFAVRDLGTTTQMSFGSFSMADDTTQPWQVVTRATASASGGVDLFTADGTRVASLAVSQGDDADNLVVAVTPGDGAPPASSDPTAPRRRLSWGFGCTATDQFAGFGAQTWGVDARGETIPVWVEEEGVGKDLTTDDPTGAWFLVGRRHSAYMPLPEFLSSRGYVAVADTVAKSTFALCSEESDVARMELELPVKVHLFFGPDPHDALSRATAHFGRPRVPPAFAFAPWNDAIFGSENVRRVAAKLRDVGAPSSVIWTEDWRGGSWGACGVSPGMNCYTLDEEWEVDRTLYPDFEEVADYLHGGGFKWLVYFNSFVEQDSKAWPETAPNGYLIQSTPGTPYTFTDAKFKPASMVDLTNPAAAAWAAGKMSAAIALGADGWMGDYGEWLPTDAVLAAGLGLDQHDAYPVLWQKAQRQALDAAIAADGVERLSFVRSGWLGTPQLADVFWAGDQRTDFEVDDGLPIVLPIGIGVGLSGVSTFGSDVAGYQSATNPTSTKELFFRWTELGAWSPVMRTHHGTEPDLEWSWESDDDSTAQWVRYAKLHMSLAPTLRGLAQAAHDTGISIWRPLAVEFPGDAPSWPVADEVMLGPGVLVAPVQAAGATSRSVYLPPGTWFPWSGGASVQGGATVTAQAPVTEIPVYALAGTLVSTYPDGVETLTVEPALAANASSVADDRVVYAFAGGSGQLAEAPDAGGLSYRLAVASTGPATWNGAPLAACDASPVAPCAAEATGQVTAYVVGPGTLVAGGSMLTCSGGASTRALTLIVRY
ncbi:MAG TPA: TIM-barrel domain-containing protein [Polyangiaceae bacterium]|jgi:alpha-glucosidase (family GH31 glycosyl hydrolase)